MFFKLNKIKIDVEIVNYSICDENFRLTDHAKVYNYPCAAGFTSLLTFSPTVFIWPGSKW